MITFETEHMTRPLAKKSKEKQGITIKDLDRMKKYYNELINFYTYGLTTTDQLNRGRIRNEINKVDAWLSQFRNHSHEVA